jgi:hypothetical protein
MGLGLAAFTGCLAYITYMRSKYDALGYYPAIQDDGREEFVKRKVEMGRLKKWQIIRSVNSNLIAYVDPLAPNF